MNGLITEGIPLGVPVQILTSGLSFGDIPPPPEPVTSSGMLYLGITATIVADQDGEYTSGYFNLPVIATRLTIQAVGTVTAVTIYLSNDGITFTLYDVIASAAIRNFQTNARWIYVTTEGTGVSVLVNARREKM